MKATPNVKRSAKPLILAIDDDLQFLNYLAVLLEYEDHSVCKSFDGEQGMDAYNQHQPRLIIVDIVMPEKDGFELIREVRKQNSITPIIAISGTDINFADQYLAIAGTIGANAILKKPIGSEELLATVNELITAPEGAELIPPK
jgi:DNA-binding response OmpR family regulator